MNAWPRVLLCILLLASTTMHAQFPAPCDTRKECIGQAVRLDEPSGRTTHFIDITGQPVKPQQTALTVEMWVKLERQPGKRVFLGGYWGPNADANDQWLLSVDEADQLCFAVSADGSNLSDIDNTVARTGASALYGVWTHIAATFDGATASVSLFVNGVRMAGPVTNALYPCTALRGGTRSDLTTQIGSCNALADNPNLFRAIKGMVDEIRLWSRVLADAEILCNKDRSLQGNETGMSLYYRCNEPVDNVVGLCDATGNGFGGLLRSGATNKRSDRVAPRTLVVVPARLTDVVRCDTTRTWTFQVSDASICGSAASVLIRGPEKGLFTVTPAQVNLLPGQPVTITVTYSGTNVGPFLDSVEIRPTNRCGQPSTYIPLALRRITQLGLSRASIQYDSLYVGCTERSYIDSTIEICNTSDSLGTGAGKPVTIQRWAVNDPRGITVVSPSLPLTLPPGACTTFVVRSMVRDTTNDYMDTLQIFSTDSCQQAPLTIVMRSRTQEVIILQNSGGGRLPDTLTFGATCPGQSSAPREYTWQNLTLAPLDIDTVIVPPDFTHYKLTFPVTLQPETGYPANAIRFRPRTPGPFVDSIIVRSRIQGCTIEKKIYVKGRGLDNRVEWAIGNLVDYGDVFVGQQRTINIVARNRSEYDTLNVSLYVEKGEAFTLLSGTGRRIPPLDSVSIPVTFRPTDSLEYFDRLCLFETRCFTVDCIPLRGKGVFETFRFSPLVMETENVIACGSREDTVYIVNNTDKAQPIAGVTFVNPSSKYVAVDPPLPWADRTIPARDSVRYIFRYVPNDVTSDRADRSFINFTSSDGSDWQVQLIGTSATPKLFVTALTAFGTLEAGDTKQATLVLENTSGLDVVVDSLTIGAGFRIVSTTRTLPLTLAPRDSMAIVVEFVPTASTTYAADLTAYSATPCDVRGVGQLTGRGVIIELESALSIVNFGYVRPCECRERIIELFNGSLVFDMTVDDIVIDSTGVPGGRPQFFSWRSTFSPSGTLPYTIPPEMRDTVTIVFCPNTPADSTMLEVTAAIHVKAHGSQWSKELETFLFGKRSLTFTPSPALVQFPSGVIDVMSATPLTVDINIPDFITNPSQDEVTIDSITFEPNDRVFFVTAPTAFPQVIRPGEALQIDVRQRPRAPRDYEARMVIHYSKPCKGTDTTVLVRGGGFAQPRGIRFTFDPARVVTDTFRMVSCDTLVLPLYSSIAIDASVVDVMMRLTYDSTQLRLLDIQSPLLANNCTSKTGGITYLSSIDIDTARTGGTHDVVMHNMCGIDTLGPFAILRFATRNNNRANSAVVIDSIDFDTEDVILYKLIATPENGVIIAEKSEIEIRNAIAYDSVRVLDCVDRTVTIFNIGDVPNSVDDMVDLPPGVSIVGAMPPQGTPVAPGDSSVLTLRFCPTGERSIDTGIVGVSLAPCDTRDTTALSGYGYAPDVEIEFGAMRTFYLRDSLGGTIGDTVEIPVMLEKDISATYMGTTYWLNGLHFDVDVVYNGRALKYLDASFLAERNMTVLNPSPGIVTVRTEGTDTVMAGELARLRFLVTVPDSTQTMVHVAAHDFVTDSLAFMDVIPMDLATPFVTTGSCAITMLKYSSIAAPAIAVHPNPVHDAATLTFQMQETVPVTCTVVDASGVQVLTMLDGSTTLSGGAYAIRFATTDFAPGLYHIRITAGIFTGTVPMVVVR